ncbi:ParA family protein [Kytococcus schroeteri]|nr:AAA family ATPase [Kytococcus schroeteri]
MTEIISVFNHKGGVSKTTTVFNLGWKLAQRGHRVVLVDADPQCNLTGVALGLNKMWPDNDRPSFEVEADDKESEAFSANQENASDFWAQNFDRTLFGALQPAFESQPKLLEPVDCLKLDQCKNLFLLPGHLRLGEYETTLAVAQELAGSLSALKNLPGALHYLVSETARQLDVDYVVVDMSPSLGALNQNIVAVSDLLVVPAAPDFFSIMAFRSLAGVIPRWIRWAQLASQNDILAEATYPFPEPRLRFAGTVIQRYKLYRKPTPDNPTGTPTRPFDNWIKKVRQANSQELTPALHRAGLTFSESEYEHAGVDDDRILAQIQDFNSLLPKAQEYRVPVFALTEDQLGQVGVVLEGSQRQIASLDRIFTDFSDRIVRLSSGPK